MGKTNSAPDPSKTADAQWKYNKKALQYGANISAVNQNTPWGSITYDRDKNGVPTSVNLNLDKYGRQFYNRSSKTRNAFLGNLSTTPFETPDYAGADQVEKAMFDRRMALLQPQFAERENAIKLDLQDRGIPIGSEIYNDSWNRYDQARGNELAALAQDSILARGAEQDRLLANALTVRNQPFNEYASFMSGTPMQQPQIPGQPAYSAAAPDYTGNVWNNYNAGQQQQSSMWNGLFGLGTAFLMSDERVKEDIERVGETDSGLPIYTYKYKGMDGPSFMGLLAQDVEEVFPDAVATIDGIKGVDYSRVA